VPVSSDQTLVFAFSRDVCRKVMQNYKAHDDDQEYTSAQSRMEDLSLFAGVRGGGGVR